MNKKTLIIISAGIIIAGLFLAGLIFFKKDQSGKVLDKNKTENHQIVPPKPEPEKLSEKEKIKIMAENFAGSYYSYTWGEFGMIEGLYYYMTDGMKEREMARVERMKKEIENQPRKYFTIQARIINSSFTEYQNNKASLSIDLEMEEFNGLVIGLEGMEILEERETLVDINGKVYEGNFEDLIGKVFDKKVEVILIKTKDEWKVNEIKN